MTKRSSVAELAVRMDHREQWARDLLAKGEVVRRVVCAANRRHDGALVCSARHNDPLMHLQKARMGGKWLPEDQGFIDQWGIFMSRQEAWHVAEAAGQIIRRVGGDDTHGGTLYSENLY